MFCFVFDNRDPYVHKRAFNIIIQPVTKRDLNPFTEQEKDMYLYTHS